MRLFNDYCLIFWSWHVSLTNYVMNSLLRCLLWFEIIFQVRYVSGWTTDQKIWHKVWTNTRIWIFFKVNNTSILLHKISLIWKQRIYEYVDYETPLRQVWAKISDWCSTIVKEICFHVLSKPRKQEILFYEELVKTTWLNIFFFILDKW